MARKLRVQYPGAIYHLMNRGDRREPFFRDATDHQQFLTTLGEIFERTGWEGKWSPINGLIGLIHLQLLADLFDS